MAYVSIDIDMDDFDTDDLLDELKNRNSLFDKKMIDEFIKEHQEINTPDVKNFSFAYGELIVGKLLLVS